MTDNTMREACEKEIRRLGMPRQSEKKLMLFWESACKWQSQQAQREADKLIVDDYCRTLSLIGHDGDIHDDIPVVLSELVSELISDDAPAPAAVPDWLPMGEAPKDHTILQLLVHQSDLPDCFDAEDPGTLSRSIGFNGFDHTGDDEWHLVGWNWQQDRFDNSLTVEPVGWLPMAPLPGAAPAPAEPDSTTSDLIRLIEFAAIQGLALRDGDGYEDECTERWRMLPDHIQERINNTAKTRDGEGGA